jgi:hypothetical protein
MESQWFLCSGKLIIAMESQWLLWQDIECLRSLWLLRKVIGFYVNNGCFKSRWLLLTTLVATESHWWLRMSMVAIRNHWLQNGLPEIKFIMKQLKKRFSNKESITYFK